MKALRNYSSMVIVIAMTDHQNPFAKGITV